MAQADSNNTPDPIYAVIEEHRAASAAYEDAIDDDGNDTSPEGVAEEHNERAMLTLCTTKPTTLAGLAALMAYLRPLYEDETIGGYGDFSDGRTNPLFETLAAATAELAGSAHQ
jgi:hypothetical protein